MHNMLEWENAGNPVLRAGPAAAETARADGSGLRAPFTWIQEAAQPGLELGKGAQF